MLQITVGAKEHYSEDAGFHFLGGTVVQLEHSLVSLSKWEAIHEKPFLGSDEKTDPELLSYIQCMVLSPDAPPNLTDLLSPQDYEEINKHLNAKHSATWFREQDKQSPSREIITGELIYYWMVSANIPISAETWHLNRLLTLLKIHGVKNSKPKKMTQQEMMSQRRALNEQRRQQFGTEG